MSAPRLWAAVLFGAAWAIAPSALAQGTGGTTATNASGLVSVTPVMIGDQSVNGLAQTYLGVAECLSDITLTFRLDNLDMSFPSIDIYLGEGCTSANRISTTTTACTFVKTVATMGIIQKLMISLQASELVSNCMSNLESMPKVWFLEVKTPHGAEEVGNNYGFYDRLNIDTLAPAAPTGLTGGEGGSEIPVVWKSSEAHLKGFVVFIDTGGTGASTGTSGTGASDSGVGGATTPDEDGGLTRVSVSGTGTTSGSGSTPCGPTLLVAGETPDSLPSSVHRKTVNERTASGVSITPGDLGGAKLASIAVSAVDLAGNQGPLSNVACVMVVPTTGFLDRYHANGGTARTGCPCSAMGPVQLQNAWPVGLSLIALGLSRRKRRS